MAVNNLNKHVSYGLTDPLLTQPPQPIVSQRVPTVNDKAEIGTIWIDQPNNDAFIITSIVNNMANWDPIGGGSAVISTLTGDVGGPVSPIAGNININGTQGAVFTGTPGTLTESFLNLQLGTSGGRFSADANFSTDFNVLQVYATTPADGAGNNYNGTFSSLNVVVGNGSEEMTAYTGRLTLQTGANISEGFGVFSYCAQNDGSVITFAQAALYGIAFVSETVAANQAPNYIAAVFGQLSFDNGAGNPVTAYLAGVVSEVDYATPLNGRGNGVLVTRDNDNGGTAGLAAFKVKQGTADRNDWLVGLDLYNGSATRAYTTADLRFWNQSFALSAAGNVTFSAVVNTDWVFKLGDSAGANALIVKAANNTTVATIESNGVILATNNMQIAGAGHGIIFPGGPAIVSGTGDPNTVVTAAKGSLYLRTDGSGVNDRAFINTDGATAWTAIVTVA